MSKKNVPQNTEASQSWADKINQNRSTYTILVAVIIFVIFISFWYINNLKQKSEKAWALVGAVSSAIGHTQVSDSNLKIADLNLDAKRLVKQKLVSMESIPEFFRKDENNNTVENLDDLYVRVLPEDLKRTALLEHYKTSLEEEIKVAKKTSATPFLYYWLGNVYFQQGDMAKAEKYYKTLAEKYPNHFLRADADRDRHIASEENTWLESNPHVTTENIDDFVSQSKTQAEITTSKGKFTITLFDKNEKVTEHFLSLAKSSFYNGLVFYKNSPEKVFTGCKIGNGLSNSGNAEVEFQDVYVQRGLVILEHQQDNYGEVDSRLYIIKKYPYFSGLQRCTILGLISEEGMKVVDSLDNVDVLLDLSVEETVNQ